MQYHHRDRSNPSHPAGDSRKLPRVDFDRRLKLEFLGSKITSDAGLLAYRELDDVLGLTDLAGAALSDLRRGKNTRHLLTGLLRQSVFGRLAGYEDVNDAERLSRDPAMRAIVDRKGLDRRAASTSQMGRFETEWLATDDNLAGLTALSGFWIDRVHDRRPPKMIALDHGQQRQPDPWRTGRNRLQRSLRMCLLSSAVRVQPVRRSGTVRPASWQRALRRWLARGAGAGRQQIPRPEAAATFVPMPPSPPRGV